jgi:hypothetical protein
MKDMQHLDETSETLETYACNIMRFHRNVTLVVRRIKRLVVVELANAKVGSALAEWGAQRNPG